MRDHNNSSSGNEVIFQCAGIGHGCRSFSWFRFAASADERPSDPYHGREKLCHDRKI